MSNSVVFSHKKVFAYTACLLVIGLLHHADHILRYDHSGWPFRAEITPFTFSLLVYPAIASLFFIRRKAYRVSIAVILAILLIGAHTFLETPIDQFNTWAHNSNGSVHAFGHPNLLDVRSPILGIASVILGMILNIGVLFLPFLFWKEEGFPRIFEQTHSHRQAYD